MIKPPYPLDPPGISDHKYVTEHLGIGDHTDMGDDFIWDILESDVNKFLGGHCRLEPTYLADVMMSRGLDETSCPSR